jgi:P27 family predicted phage terminase small subunit
LQVLRGNPGKRSLPREPAFERERECPDRPPFLDGHARDEYWRMAPGLHVLGMLTTVDLMPLAAYCVAYSRWRTAEERLQEMAARDQVMSGLLVKSPSGDARRNPLAKISADSAADMVRYASEFGFTAATRAKISAGIGGASPSKFGDLLA